MMLQGPVSRKLAELERSGALAAMVRERSASKKKIIDVRSRRWTAEKLPLVVTSWEPSREGPAIDQRGAMVVTLDRIVTEAAAEFGFAPADIRGRHEQKALARPRQAAIHIARLVTKMSPALIGRLLGGRDRTTVLYAGQRAAELMQIDEDFALSVTAIMERIGCGGGER